MQASRSPPSPSDSHASTTAAALLAATLIAAMLTPLATAQFSTGGGGGVGSGGGSPGTSTGGGTPSGSTSGGTPSGSTSGGSSSTSTDSGSGGSDGGRADGGGSLTGSGDGSLTGSGEGALSGSGGGNLTGGGEGGLGLGGDGEGSIGGGLNGTLGGDGDGSLGLDGEGGIDLDGDGTIALDGDGQFDLSGEGDVVVLADGSLTAGPGVDLLVKALAQGDLYGDHPPMRTGLRLDAEDAPHPKGHAIDAAATWRFDAPLTQPIRISVHSTARDAPGPELRMLGWINLAMHQASGHVHLTWDQRDQAGAQMPAGRYAIVAEAGEHRAWDLVRIGEPRGGLALGLDGGLTLAGDGSGRIEGDRVRFTVDDGGRISGLALDGNIILENLTIEGDAQAEVKGQGIVAVQSGAGAVVLGDTPGSMFALTASGDAQLSGGDTTFHLALPEGARVDIDDGEGVAVVHLGTTKGVLAATGDTQARFAWAEDGGLRVTLPASASASAGNADGDGATLGAHGGGAVTFRATTGALATADRPASVEAAMAEAALRGKLAADAVVTGDGDVAAEGPVAVTLTGSSPDSTRFLVDGEGPEGGLVAFHFDSGPWATADGAARAEVRFDGQAALRAEDVRVLLQGCDAPTAAVVHHDAGTDGRGSTDVVLCVPHFSPHTVEVTSQAQGGAMHALSSPLPMLLLVAFAGAAVAGLVLTGAWMQRHGWQLPRKG